MKTKSFAVIVSGTAVALLCLAGACFPQTSKAQTESTPAPTVNDSTPPDAPDGSAALPPDVSPSSPLAQVIKLTQSGVSEDVIMAYVTNSTSTFNLNPDQIIYLKDIGAPDDLVTAMIQRDQVLQAQMAASAYQPPPQTAPVTETVAAAPAPAEATVEQAPVTVDYFYSTLAPYGSWVYVAGYGRCWRPTVTVVNTGWQPYCDHGHWVWTDCGWYWISDYSWGWAPFHYGRWFHNSSFGWCWTPDTVWGPSWVTWRYSGDYCGWAPLPPHCVYRAGVGFFYNGVAVSVGFNFGLGASAYTFVPTRNFCDPHPWHYRVAPTHVTQIYNNTTVINNFDVDRRNQHFVNHGIDPQHITEVTHAPIRPVAIHETTTRVPRGEQLGRDGRTLMVNRPHFSDNPPPLNRGTASHTTTPPPVGSAYQGTRNDNQNNNSQPHRYPSTAPTPGQPQPSQPAVGGPSQPSRNYQTAPPAQTPGQRQYPPVTTSGSPGHNEITTPTGRSPSPVNRSAPVAPAQPLAPNQVSTDNRRYPSPHMQQIEQQNPGVTPGSSGGRAGASATPPGSPAPLSSQPPAPRPAIGSAYQGQGPQRNYGAPVPAPLPPVRQAEANHFVPPAQQPAPPPQRNYVSPRNETSPGGSHYNYSQSAAAGSQTRSAPASSSPPAQSQPSQGSSRGRNQNGQ